MEKTLNFENNNKIDKSLNDEEKLSCTTSIIITPLQGNNTIMDTSSIIITSSQENNNVLDTSSSIIDNHSSLPIKIVSGMIIE